MIGNTEIRSYGKPVLIGVDMAPAGDVSAIAVRTGSHVVMSVAKDAEAAIDAEWINGLNASRKADREALALAFETIARAHGAKVERREEKPCAGYSGAGIYLNFSLNGVGVQTSISNLHGGFHGLASWFNDYASRSPASRGALDFSSAFNVAVGEYSGRPHHKATSCGRDWLALAKYLDGGLRVAARGEAFRPSAT